MIKKIYTHGFWRGRENLLAAGILSIAMVIRVIDIFTRNFDSDEPQHLHVIWGWAHGYVQYRDIFDNHTPLFHMMFAPLFALLPEWHGALYVMRLAALPFYLATLLCTYLIGKILFSHRTGLWAMVFLALYGRFFIKTLEFRPDSLWTALLMLGIYLMVRRPLTAKSSVLVGVVFGAALAVSFKTMILLIALIISLPLAWAVAGGYSMPILKKKLINCCYGIAGFLIIPTALIIVFYCLNALPEFYYGVIQHNSLAHGNSMLDYGFIKDKRIIQFLLSMVAICCFAWYIGDVTQDAENRLKRVFVMATSMSYFAILFTFWPIVTHQTQLPAFPLLIISLTPFLMGEYPLLGKVMGRSFKQGQGGKTAPPTFLLAAIAIAQLFMLTKESSMVGQRLNQDQQMWKDILRYTDPGDYVMDAKGESIFRMRPYFYGFETITMQLVASGVIPDNSADSLVAKPTYVVVAKKFYRYPGRLKSFVQNNYLRTGTLFVAGKKLADNPAGSNAPTEFSIALPGRYAIISRKGRLVPGTLNGKYGTGVFDFQTGQQEFIASAKASSLTVIWDKAWQRGIRLPN
jgi:hypothetical protein